MKFPIEDTIWGASYGSVQAVQAAFDRVAPEYHRAIVASGVPLGAATALMPHLFPDSQGIDFGCGSGVLGHALRSLGSRTPLDGIDISPVMLDLARETGHYRHLYRANLLAPEECPELSAPYDFAISVGLVGDYVPHYVALPHLVSLLKPGAFLGFAVEQRSTPWRALETKVEKLELSIISETELRVPEGTLEGQWYHFYVTRLTGKKSVLS